MNKWRSFWLIIFFFLTSVTLTQLPSVAFAALSYGSGTYTNLCGTATAATADTCSRGCNTEAGTCSSSQPYVVKWTCDGNLTECRSNESPFASSYSLAGTSCGKTVQIDVFQKNCRNMFGWMCEESDLLDYIVWYSGACAAPPATPTPTPILGATLYPTATPLPQPTATPYPTATPILTATPVPYQSSCDSLTVVGGQNSLVPANVTLRARATDTGGSIQAYRFYFGDGQQTETSNLEVQHRYESSGNFIARVDIKDSHGIWKTSGSCETTVSVQPVAIESQKSDCSDLFILEGNYTQAPVTAKFQVTGYDNKGGIKQYKLDFGNDIVKESDSGHFEQVYDRAGTYTLRGYILDSQNNWKGGANSCQKTLYISTKPLTTQPKTGTPTEFTVLGLGSGVTVLSLLLRKKLNLSKHNV